MRLRSARFFIEVCVFSCFFTQFYITPGSREVAYFSLRLGRPALIYFVFAVRSRTFFSGFRVKALSKISGTGSAPKAPIFFEVFGSVFIHFLHKIDVFLRVRTGTTELNI